MEDHVKVTYTLSSALMADGLTKALQGPKFKEFVSQLNLVDIHKRLERRRLTEKEFS